MMLKATDVGKYTDSFFREVGGAYSENGGEESSIYVLFEVFTAVTMKNGVFWVVTPCGSCKNRRFGGT
jgi:hypothetical protein